MPSTKTVIVNIGSGAFMPTFVAFDLQELSQIVDFMDEGFMCALRVQKPMSWGMFDPVGPQKNVGPLSFPVRGVKRVLVAT